MFFFNYLYIVKQLCSKQSCYGSLFKMFKKEGTETTAGGQMKNLSLYETLEMWFSKVSLAVIKGMKTNPKN